MSKNKKRLWLMSMVLIYIAIAVFGFVIAYIVKKDFLSSGPAAIPTPIIAKEKSVSVPNDWKTYTNSDNKVKLSYPPQDHIKTSSYGFGVTNVSLLDSADDADFQILLLPKSLAQAVGQDFDGFYSMPNNTTKVIKSPMAQDNTTEKFTKISNTSINGLQALDYQSIASTAKSGTEPEIGTFIVAGDNLVLISTGASNKTKLEQMLSSFIYPL